MRKKLGKAGKQLDNMGERCGLSGNSNAEALQHSRSVVRAVGEHVVFLLSAPSTHVLVAAPAQRIDDRPAVTATRRFVILLLHCAPRANCSLSSAPLPLYSPR